MPNLNTQKLISLINPTNQQNFFEYLLNGEPLTHFANQPTELQTEIEELEMAGMSPEDLIKSTCYVIQNGEVETTKKNNFYLVLKTRNVIITYDRVIMSHTKLIKLEGVEYSYYISMFNNNLNNFIDFYSEGLSTDYACLDI